MVYPKSLITFVLTAALLGAPKGWADDGAPTARVRFGDLDLHRPDHVLSLEARVRHAARRVCGAQAARTLADRASSAKCVAETHSDVAARLAALTPSPVPSSPTSQLRSF